MDSSIDGIREQARNITASGVLGRSRSYRRLLEFLVECAAEGRTPKELEIATEVFGKGADFDPAQDSMVRVYVHHLRQKIQQYYREAGRDEPEQLSIPKGEYRVLLASAAEPAPAAAPAAGRRGRAWYAGLAAAGIAIAALGFAAGNVVELGTDEAPRPYEAAAASPLWSELLDDDVPILLVVGDYYIFGELDQAGNVDRLVREFSVNSSQELDEFLMFHSDSAYMDLDLTYLPRSTAHAMSDVLRVLYTSSKPVRVASMSDLSVAELKSNHIVYIGYVSGLDKLSEFVFASSGLSVGDTYDELVDEETGQVYWSEAGVRGGQRKYRDYGLYSTFPGPGSNQFVIVAGTFDAGLMHSAQAVTDPASLRVAEQAMPETLGPRPPAFEMLYEVTGNDRTNLDAMLIRHGQLDYRTIWGGELTLAE